MAVKRMFSLKIVDTDEFLDMPLSTQSLYFHLGMRADDEGFVGNTNRIMRMIGSSADDLKILLAKRFIIEFDSGVYVIKHWKINNYIQNDRTQKTTYLEEKASLFIKENKSYSECIQNVSIDKIRLEEISIEESSIVEISEVIDTKPSTKDIKKKFNDIVGLSTVKKIIGSRLKSLNARIKEYSFDEVVEVLDNVSESDFLKGDNDRQWKCNFDWIMNPNNFVKILEGNYKNKKDKNGLEDIDLD